MTTTLLTLALVLLALGVIGVLALSAAVVRGDGRVGPGLPPAQRHHPADVFETVLRRLT